MNAESLLVADVGGKFIAGTNLVESLKYVVACLIVEIILLFLECY